MGDIPSCLCHHILDRFVLSLGFDSIVLAIQVVPKAAVLHAIIIIQKAIILVLRLVSFVSRSTED